MDESVALDSSKQKDFVKSVRGIKKLLKKRVKKTEDATKVEKQIDVGTEENLKKKRRKNRGLVYLSHIPHGFYEQQMTEYFKQFGVVTNARVIRSKRTGNSKGFAFVEFKEPAVAEIVAETMNNYLMGKRLIKAAYIPPNKQRIHALRKKWNKQNNPGADQRLKLKKMNNANKSIEEELKIARKLLSTLSKTKKKLSDIGIDYDFFMPVDVPEALKDRNDDIKSQEDNKPLKPDLKKVKLDNTLKAKIKTESEDVTKIEVKIEKKSKKQNQKQDTNEKLRIQKSLVGDKRKDKGENKNQEVKKLEKVQKKSSDNFISIKEPDNSDSSIDFDSDEFESMMKNDDHDLSSDDQSSESQEEEQTNKIDRKKSTIGSKSKVTPKLESANQNKENTQKAKTQSVKRKNNQGVAATVKKPKFEKQNKRPTNKLLKKLK